MNKEIEEVAAWPWRRKYAYAISYGVLQEDVEDVDMPDNAPSGANMPSGAKMPSSTPSVGRTGNGAKAAVSHHDHIMNVK